MNRDQLVAFERIVREGSFNRAAQRLGVSQAAISGRIQALETEVGGPLFVRGGRRVSLTSAGETFLPYARRTLAVLGEGIEATRLTQTGQRGRLSIGANPSIADGMLVTVVTRYRASHPDVVISVRTGHTPQIVQEMADGVVRLGLVTWRYVTGTVDIHVLARFHEPMVAVAAPTHPLVRRGTLTIDDVVRESRPFHETDWGTAEDARIAGTTQQSWPEHEFPHGLMRRLILRGIGTGFFPEPLVADELAEGRLVALPLTDDDGLTRELALISQTPADALPVAAQEFVSSLRAEAARLRSG